MSATAEQDTSRLSAREREAVWRCYREFYKDSVNASASIERTALVFQISASTVRRILRKKEEGQILEPKCSTGRKPVTYSYGFKETLNDFIFMKIKKNEYLNLDIMLEYAKENLDFEQSKTSLYRLIKKIGYKFKKVDRRYIIIERQQNVIQRVRFCGRYLELLKEDVIFVFLDETWVFQNGSQVRQWVLETTPKGIPSTFKNEGRRYIILNAGTEDGFLPGCDFILESNNNDRDYHKTMNGELFKSWVLNNLIPALRSLSKKCVIVMDNAPYHSVKIDKIPTTSANKETLRKWLREHNIYVEDYYTKKQLLDLIEPFKSNQDYNKYEIDGLLELEGHEVLRLPPYNCQYNPIELAWGFCKTYYNQRIPGKLGGKEKVESVWREAIQNCTKEKWSNFIRHTETEIKTDWEKYMGIKDVSDIPPFIINVGADSSDSEDENMENDGMDSEEEEVVEKLDDEEEEEIVIMVVDDSE